MIRHTVAFALRHPPGSGAELSFLAAARALATIPGVRNFELICKRSTATGFAFEMSMEFANDRVYENYNTHPDHMRFVMHRWKPEVLAYREQDFSEQDFSKQVVDDL